MTGITKTKSRRVWLGSFPHWEHPEVYFSRDSLNVAKEVLGEGLQIIPATLTWAPPTKKRSAKR